MRRNQAARVEAEAALALAHGQLAAVHEAVEHHRQARPVIIEEIIESDDDDNDNAGAIPMPDVAPVEAEAPVELPAAPLAIEAPPTPGLIIERWGTGSFHRF